ncbi:hypothetical protein PQR34_44155 [Paraburkholderia sediminicola]
MSAVASAQRICIAPECLQKYSPNAYGFLIDECYCAASPDSPTMAAFATQIEGSKMRVLKFALAVLTACFTLNASAEMTAAQYKLWAHSDNNSVYAAYITGTINALGWANGDLVTKKRPPLFCPPQNLAIGNQNVYPLLDQFFTNHPGLSDDFPIGLAILRTLQAAFPC